MVAPLQSESLPSKFAIVTIKVTTKPPLVVIPAKAGSIIIAGVDSRLRGYDRLSSYL
jgi:hypothetical protein